MTLFDYMKVTMEDYDTYDTVYDAIVTVCWIDESEENDNYEKFCIGIIKKVDVENASHCGESVNVKWTELITNNMEKFREFTKKYWRDDCQYEDDEDEFICQWIDEIQSYMAGYVSETFYKVLVELVGSLQYGGENSEVRS